MLRNTYFLKIKKNIRKNRRKYVLIFFWRIENFENVHWKINMKIFRKEIEKSKIIFDFRFFNLFFLNFLYWIFNENLKIFDFSDFSEKNLVTTKIFFRPKVFRILKWKFLWDIYPSSSWQDSIFSSNRPVEVP